MMTLINRHWNLEFKGEVVNSSVEIKNNFIGYFKVCKIFLRGDVLTFGSDPKR